MCVLQEYQRKGEASFLIHNFVINKSIIFSSSKVFSSLSNPVNWGHKLGQRTLSPLDGLDDTLF